MRFADKVAVVTGAGRGIGRGIALRLAREGASVVVNDFRNMALAGETAAAITALGDGRRGVAVEADVVDRAAMERMFARIDADFGRIDIAVVNAAVSIRKPVVDFPPEEFQRVIDVVQMGCFHTCQLAARRMVSAGRGGKIIAIGSIHAEQPIPRSAPYNMAKAAVNHFVATLAGELAAHRINVNAINPGWIDTPGEHETFGSEVVATEGPQLPWGRIGTPDDIAGAVAFLASDEADYITGAALRVDGGFVLR
jgi:glucose 1-dehydrogenase